MSARYLDDMLVTVNMGPCTPDAVSGGMGRLHLISQYRPVTRPCQVTARIREEREQLHDKDCLSSALVLHSELIT